jgi:hypothetical protein
MGPRLTYANVTATLALIIAVGGASAFAATQLAKNSVGAKQLKKNAVTASKIKNGAVIGAKIGDLSSLGAVPEALHAHSADHAAAADHASSANLAANAKNASNASKVGGLSVVKFERTGVAPLASPITIESIGGMEFQYACEETGGSDTRQFRFENTIDGAKYYLVNGGISNVSTAGGYPLSAGAKFALERWMGTGIYSAPGGHVVTFTWRTSTQCTEGVVGTAYGG